MDLADRWQPLLHVLKRSRLEMLLSPELARLLGSLTEGQICSQLARVDATSEKVLLGLHDHFLLGLPLCWLLPASRPGLQAALRNCLGLELEGGSLAVGAGAAIAELPERDIRGPDRRLRDRDRRLEADAGVLGEDPGHIASHFLVDERLFIVLAVVRCRRF